MMLLIIGAGLTLAAALTLVARLPDRRLDDLGSMSARWIAEHRRWQSDRESEPPLPAGHQS